VATYGTTNVYQCTFLSNLIGRPMQCHIGFFMMWRSETGERARGRCLAKQPPHARNNYLIKQLHNRCMSCCCHTTHNILFYMHKLRNYIDLPDDYQTIRCTDYMLSRPKIIRVNT
jgi:hypothetical protein